MEEQKQNTEQNELDLFEEIRAKKQEEKTQLGIDVEEAAAEWHQAWAQFKKENNLNNEEAARAIYDAFAGAKQDTNNAEETESEEEEMDPEDEIASEEEVYVCDLLVAQSKFFVALCEAVPGDTVLKLYAIAYRERSLFSETVKGILQNVVAEWESKNGSVDILTEEEFADETLFLEQYRKEKGLSPGECFKNSVS